METSFSPLPITLSTSVCIAPLAIPLLRIKSRERATNVESSPSNSTSAECRNGRQLNNSLADKDAPL